MTKRGIKFQAFESIFYFMSKHLEKSIDFFFGKFQNSRETFFRAQNSSNYYEMRTNKRMTLLGSSHLSINSYDEYRHDWKDKIN